MRTCWPCQKLLRMESCDTLSRHPTQPVPIYQEMIPGFTIKGPAGNEISMMFTYLPLLLAFVGGSFCYSLTNIILTSSENTFLVANTSFELYVLVTICSTSL